MDLRGLKMQGVCGWCVVKLFGIVIGCDNGLVKCVMYVVIGFGVI